jgi:hypothetical protein
MHRPALPMNVCAASVPWNTSTSPLGEFFALVTCSLVTAIAVPNESSGDSKVRNIIPIVPDAIKFVKIQKKKKSKGIEICTLIKINLGYTHTFPVEQQLKHCEYNNKK